MTTPEPVARLEGVTHRYGKVLALEDVSLDLPAGRMVGLIGPDGVGKSTLMGLVAGAKRMQAGGITCLGGDMGSTRHRNEVGNRLAFMPQGWARISTMTFPCARTWNSSASCLDWGGLIVQRGSRG